MTKMALTNTQCPQCQTTWRRQLYSSVNVTLDPTLKPKVLSGEIFKARCPSCEHTTPAAYDCLYHDMNLALMISLTGESGFENKMKALTGALSSLSHSELYRLRVVTSVHDLFEKIFVFDADLNDGVVELMKIILPSQKPELKGAMLRFQALDDTGALAFAVVRPGTSPQFVAVPRDYYEAVRTKAFSDLATMTEQRGQWLRVDFDMVGQYMASKQSV